MSGNQWAHAFKLNDDDIEYVTGLLLERETPLTTDVLLRAIIERRLASEAAALHEQFKDTRVYNPADHYEPGQRVIFPRLSNAIGTVEAVRSGDNVEYGDFGVMTVALDDGTRHYAFDLAQPHPLNDAASTPLAFAGSAAPTLDDVLAAAGAALRTALEDRLTASGDLLRLADQWFPFELLLDVNEGHLNLAEAVLDMMEGGPLDAAGILEQIGGLGASAPSLQAYSLNFALSQDKRFDEVGPAGKVLWFLARSEPEEVLQTPAMLRYTPIESDRSFMTAEMLALESEIDDEWSPIEADVDPSAPFYITLIYPHRRVGTLPLNAKMRRIFPTARRTSHIWVTLVDAQDDEEFTGWVVSKDRYVFGLTPLFRKHKLPIGAFVSVRAADEGKIIVDFRSHKPRTEWIRLITPKNNQIAFENHKRAIGAEYDDLMIVGADELAPVDALFTQTHREHRGVAAYLRQLIAELSRLTPQGTVHFKTLYSALNIVRRCPPAPIFAALVNDPDFEHVGNHYWRLANRG